MRNVVAPERDLGHTDRALKKDRVERELKDGSEKGEGGGQGKACEDCS